MARIVRIHRTGGPEVLEHEEMTLPPPGPGEVQLKQTALGLNFIDVYYRSGLYTPPLPMTPGQEGAGVITALGSGVAGFAVGQRVAYAGALGGYADVRNVRAEVLVRVPDGIDDVTAAAVMLKGMTADMLLNRVQQTKRGDVVLIHAAAGGVGQLATQWARHLGATVIGTVGRAEKAVLAAKNCHHVLVTGEGPWVEKVRALTGGKGVDVVFDSVGRDTVPQSLDALRSRGLLVSFGQSSGRPEPLDIVSLGGLRSLFITRPSLHAWNHTREELERASASLFSVLTSGAVKVSAPTTFALAEVAKAHRALENRETTGSVVLIP